MSRVTRKKFFNLNKDTVLGKIAATPFKGSNKVRIDWLLLSITAFMVILGLAFLASALSSRNLSVYQSEFIKQFVFGVWIGGGICFFLAITDYHKLLKYRNLFLIFALLTTGFLFSFIATAYIFNLNLRELVDTYRFLPIQPSIRNNSIRWLNILNSFSFQPAEGAKLALLVYFAGYIYTAVDLKRGWRTIYRPLLLITLCILMILLQPDLGSIVSIALIVLSQMWVSKAPRKIFVVLSILVVAVGVISTMAYSYRLNRINTFMDFVNNSVAACNTGEIKQENYQVCQIRFAISNGGVWGRGYGNSSAKINNLIPEVTTDGIMAVIGEEVGFVGIMGLIMLYLMFFARAIKIARNAPDFAGKALAMGVGVWVISQAFFNMAGVIGLLPLKGAPLPFISEGGTSLVLNLASVGILFNVSAQSDMTQKGTTRKVELRQRIS
jgi:cell division protein FtsW